MSDGRPMPPQTLLERVGVRDESDPAADYLALGRDMLADIEVALGEGWSWRDRRILDFGCGAGRLLRHLAPHAERGGATLLGCDIDGEAIDWLAANLSPPVTRAFVNDHEPPLDLADDAVDVVIAASVFTHLAESWARWLLELHRVLKPGGMLVASILSRGWCDEEWSDERFGMNVIFPDHLRWQRVNVMHSEWWLRAHWGRAFEILSVTTSGFAAPEGEGQGLLVARARPEAPSEAELKGPEPGEEREVTALRHNLAQQASQTVERAMELEAARAELASRGGGVRGRASRLRRRIRRRRRSADGSP